MLLLAVLMQPGSVGRPRLGPQRLAWALAWAQLGMLALKFHQLVVPKLVPWSRLHPNAFVLFCCHLWQSKRGSRPRLVLLFQSDATSGTDRLERSVEVSIHKFFSLEQYILKVINQISLVLEPKKKKKKFFTLKWNPSYTCWPNMGYWMAMDISLGPVVFGLKLIYISPT